MTDIQNKEYELEYWQTRVDEMQVIIETVKAEREQLHDVATSLHEELEATKIQLKQSESIISRLRLHIAQGIEL
jgi:chromosome segregation ATPase